MASTKQSSRKGVLKEVATIGLDLAETTVQFVGLDARGHVLTRCHYCKGQAAAGHRDDEPLPHRNGGLLRRPLPKAPAAGPGPRRQAHAAKIRHALRQARQVSVFTMQLSVIYGRATVLPRDRAIARFR